MSENIPVQLTRKFETLGTNAQKRFLGFVAVRCPAILENGSYLKVYEKQGSLTLPDSRIGVYQKQSYSFRRNYEIEDDLLVGEVKFDHQINSNPIWESTYVSMTIQSDFIAEFAVSLYMGEDYDNARPWIVNVGEDEYYPSASAYDPIAEKLMNRYEKIELAGRVTPLE